MKIALKEKCHSILIFDDDLGIKREGSTYYYLLYQESETRDDLIDTISSNLYHLLARLKELEIGGLFFPLEFEDQYIAGVNFECDDNSNLLSMTYVRSGLNGHEVSVGFQYFDHSKIGELVKISRTIVYDKESILSEVLVWLR